ncbi:hypothetical protein P1X14_12330 [Sphingomonas sp. AOB5]|uniref:hypothetical protein n=1 Tax=Sphingomonas sp. AOB5 TaxID=3034017 RepID=UPI0023F8E000|nr:hypothetical protein [Sphingomonas sp. AOB5]MDF7776037.1 hypothetical protein [Sphingomonas sp. AOB5]
MREPTATTKLLGHPLVAGALTLGCFGMLAGCWQSDTNLLLPGLLAFAIMTKTGTAVKARSSYLAWKRAWDGMADRPVRRPQADLRKALGIVGMVALTAYGVANPDSVSTRLGIVLVAFALLLIALRALGNKLRQPQASTKRATKTDVVTLCAARPLMPVPTLNDAYRALPDHCWQVMGR